MYNDQEREEIEFQKRMNIFCGGDGNKNDYEQIMKDFGYEDHQEAVKALAGIFGQRRIEIGVCKGPSPCCSTLLPAFIFRKEDSPDIFLGKVVKNWKDGNEETKQYIKRNMYFFFAGIHAPEAKWSHNVKNQRYYKLYDTFMIAIN